MKLSECIDVSGLFLYGRDSTKLLCGELGVSERTMRRWIAGTQDAPDGALYDLIGLLRSRSEDFQDMADLIETRIEERNL